LHSHGAQLMDQLLVMSYTTCKVDATWPHITHQKQARPRIIYHDGHKALRTDEGYVSGRQQVSGQLPDLFRYADAGPVPTGISYGGGC
jgi:hypothetical protein